MDKIKLNCLLVFYLCVACSTNSNHCNLEGVVVINMNYAPYVDKVTDDCQKLVQVVDDYHMALYAKNIQNRTDVDLVYLNNTDTLLSERFGVMDSYSYVDSLFHTQRDSIVIYVYVQEFQKRINICHLCSAIASIEDNYNRLVVTQLNLYQVKPLSLPEE